jgi:hypothetical protein
VVHLCSHYRSISGFDSPNERCFARVFDPFALAELLVAKKELTAKMIRMVELPRFDLAGC